MSPHFGVEKLPVLVHHVSCQFRTWTGALPFILFDLRWCSSYRPGISSFVSRILRHPILAFD